jgi:hypothetical protein
MDADLRYPELNVTSGSVLGFATAFTEDGAGVYGRLAVDQEGHVVFVASEPDHDPEKE